MFHRTGIRYVRCRVCGLVYTNPVESGDDLRSTGAGMERVSVIVPVYNEERYVRDVIEALLAKDLAIDREIIIVESNSADSSRAIVRSFAHEPRGESSCRTDLSGRATPSVPLSSRRPERSS